jgi:hypothetical protein
MDVLCCLNRRQNRALETVALTVNATGFHFSLNHALCGIASQCVLGNRSPKQGETRRNDLPAV